MNEQVRCEHCGWINQAGQTACSWCHAPLPSADADVSAGSEQQVPPPPSYFAAPGAEPGQQPPPGFYRGSDGKTYSQSQPFEPRRRTHSPCFILGMIAIGLVAVPFVIVTVVIAACFISMAQPAHTQVPGSSMSGQLILMATGAVAIILLLVFSSRRTKA